MVTDAPDGRARDIFAGIGGAENILRLANAVTRVSVEVQDDRLLDIPRLNAAPAGG